MIEIQIVPSDVRRNVRYVFFDRKRELVAIVALSIVLAGVIGSMAAAPTVRCASSATSSGISAPVHEKDDPRDVEIDDARHREQALRHAMLRLQQQLEILSRFSAVRMPNRAES